MNSDQENNLKDFFFKYKGIKFEKGDTVIHGEDEPSGVYFIKSGYIKMSSIHENNGAETILNIFKPGSYLPMIWALTNIKNKYYYKALSDVETYRVPKEDLVNYLRLNVDVLMDLTSRILTGLDGTLSITKSTINANSTKKVAIIYTMLAKRFGKINKDNQIEIEIPLTHQDIANFVGISRETASLAIDKLRKEGVIITDKKTIIIPDPKRLEDF